MWLIKARPRLFAYQVMVEAVPLTTPAATLDQTITSEPQTPLAIDSSQR